MCLYGREDKTTSASAQAAALRWAATAMRDGRGKACMEAALRAATAGTLDKGAEAREAGSALILTLLQVILPLCLQLCTAVWVGSWQTTSQLQPR